MEISNQGFRVHKSWRREGLQIDISEINSTFDLKKPKISEIITEDTLIDQQRYGVSSKQGKFRKNQEDAFQVVLELHNSSFKHAFAVFDGHSGPEASKYASAHLITNMHETTEQSIKEAFKITDNNFCIQNYKKGGTTAALSIIDHSKLLTANLGDTRIILVSSDSFEVLSYDHIASDLNEQMRVEKAGGYITKHRGLNRVCGHLAITRSIGDSRYKDYIISSPFVKTTKINYEHLALVIASDGLFEVLSCEEVSEIVREKFEFSCGKIAEVLSSEAIEGGSRDNVTVMVVKVREFYQLAASKTDRNKEKKFKFE